MVDEQGARQAAGVAAILAGMAWLAWVILNGVTRGGLDAGVPTISANLAWTGQGLMVAWNILLVPAAVLLFFWLRPRSPRLMLFCTLCGLASLLLWSYGGATGHFPPHLEAVYLLLSAIWWLGAGFVLMGERRALGIFTVVLGLFALLDGLFALPRSIPFYIYVLAAPKVPLSVVWDFWLGVAFLTSALRFAPKVRS